MYYHIFEWYWNLYNTGVHHHNGKCVWAQGRKYGRLMGFDIGA